jgi:hypothetical protein
MNKIISTLVILLAASMAFAQGVRYSATVLTTGGFPNATVYVCLEPATDNPSGPGCTPLANIYSDPALQVPVTQPFQTDANGNFSFFANPTLTYHINISGTGLNTYDIPYVTLPGGGGGGGGGGSVTAFQSVTFTSLSIVTLATTFQTTNLLYQCWDNNGNAINGFSPNVNTSTFVVTFTFASPQTGYCVVSGGTASGSGDSVVSYTASGNIAFLSNNIFGTCTGGSSGITLTLPSAVGLAGRKVTLIKGDSGVGPCSTSGSVNSYPPLVNQYQYVVFESNNVNWYVVGNN